MTPQVLAATLLLAIAFSASPPAIGAQTTPSATPTTRVPRGAIATFEIEHPAGPLRAKALRDGSTPILVRVAALGGPRHRHRIEYLGVVEGEFDLLPLLEQVDGRPPEGLSPLPVEIYTQLPPNPATDLYGLPEPTLGLEGRYRAALWTLGVVWLAVPVVAIARRLLRRPPPAPATEPPPPSPLERVRALLEEAQARPLDVAERGRFELLLLQALRDAAPGAGDLAEATARLRREPASAPVVRAVERWLHVADGERRRDEALDRVTGAVRTESRP